MIRAVTPQESKVTYIKGSVNPITEIREGFGRRREAAAPRKGASPARDRRAVAHGAVPEAPPPPEAPRHHLLPLAQVAANQGRKAAGRRQEDCQPANVGVLPEGHIRS